MFSIVIPLYNKSQTIIRCLNSILSQTYTDFEVLIINDGSTDESIEIIKRNFDDERLYIINKSNGGVSSARNLGISCAKYDHVAFIDADDTWEKKYLEIMFSIIEKFPNAALYGCRQKFVYPTGKTSFSYYPNSKSVFIFDHEEYFQYAKEDIMFHASAIIVNKQILTSLDIAFDENLVKGEDLDFYFRIAFKHKMLLYNDLLTNYYVDAPNSAMKNPCPLKKRLIGNISKFISTQNNKTTNEFFSEYILSCYKLLMNEYSGDNKDIVSIMNLINVSDLPILKKVYYYLPNFIKRYI